MCMCLRLRLRLRSRGFLWREGGRQGRGGSANADERAHTRAQICKAHSVCPDSIPPLVLRRPPLVLRYALLYADGVERPLPDAE